MNIGVLTLTGKRLKFTVKANATVEDVKEKIWDTEGHTPDEQRLIFAGQQLMDNQSLSDYDIENGNILHLLLRLHGMISNFSEYDESDLLTAFLMKGDVDGVEISDVLLKERRNKFEGLVSSKLKLEHTGNSILSESQRQKLIGIANFLHSTQQIEGKSDNVLQDLKIIFPRGAINDITKSQTAESMLQRHHGASHGSTKFVLRRTSPTKGCLPWQVDGGYSTAVVQYTLNSDNSYKGGRLCYFSNDTGLYDPAGQLVQCWLIQRRCTLYQDY